MRVGNVFMLIGAGLFLVGALIRFAPGLVSWFGHLPGDIRFESDNTRVYFPITSLIVTSLVVSLLAAFVGRILRGR